MVNIPIVDMKGAGITVEKPDPDDKFRVSKALCDAFSNIGFAYLTNHGFPEEEIRKLFKISKDFFELPEEIKDSYSRSITKLNGYSKPGQEILGDKQVMEHKESFDISTFEKLPEKELPEFGGISKSFVAQCEKLTIRLLEFLAIGLGLNEGFFKAKHLNLMSSNNCTCLRTLYYPPVGDKTDGLDTRCSAHTDYGTFTLLFQDSIGGLQVMSKNEKWIAATPINNTILVNIGDLMQFWSSNRLPATMHRVCIPDEGECKTSPRQSIVFFVHPDDEVIVEPIDGSNIYKPISALQHTIDRFRGTYSY